MKNQESVKTPPKRKLGRSTLKSGAAHTPTHSQRTRMSWGTRGYLGHPPGEHTLLGV
jgi:hypothetical protein